MRAKHTPLLLSWALREAGNPPRCRGGLEIYRLRDENPRKHLLICNQVVIPRFILDADPNANVYVAQPRRISAMSVASRVAQEAGEQVGGQIGYAVHLDARRSEETRCHFVTTGVLRRRLFQDPKLTGITHLILDEMHEREKVADFVLTCVKHFDGSTCKIIVMSATLEMDTFTDYFEDCGVVQVEGRVYPVEELFLDEIAPILFEKDPKVLGPAFAAAGLGLEEKSFKYRCMVESPYHKDGVCGFGYNMHCPLDEGRLADGLAKHDVLQEIRGLTHDVKLLVALIRNIDETDRVDSPTCAHDRAVSDWCVL